MRAYLATAPERLTLARLLTLVRTVPGWFVLVGIVAISTGVRLMASGSRPIPRYLPDEYIYASLARSLAEGGLSIRGRAASFPALLEPLLAAPFALVGNVELAFRLTLGMHAVAMSLAAVPVYLLAQRLGLPRWQVLASAAFSVSVPAMLYTSYWTADAVGYSLAVSAVAAGVWALEHPTRRAQSAFLSLAVLATFARVQYVVLLPAFVGAALLLSGRRPWEALRRYRLLLVVLGAAAGLLLAVGATRVLGYYESVLDLHVDLGGMGRWAGIDLLLLAYASGLVLIPAAVAGLIGCSSSSAPAVERAFAALTVLLALGLLFEAVLYATNGSNRFQERYLMALIPLVPVAACLGWQRLPAGRLLMVATAGALFVASVRIPLSGYTAADAKQDSPFLFGVHRLETVTGAGIGALIIALTAGALLLIAVAAAYRPKLGRVLVLGAAVAVSVSCAWAATVYDHELDASVRAQFGGDSDWVDRAALGDSALLVAPGASRASLATHLFWNASVKRVLILPGGAPPDAYGSDAAIIDRDGRLLVDGATVESPLLIDETQVQAELSGAELVRRTGTASLWKPRGIPRLSILTLGRYADGGLAWPKAVIRVWAGTSGTRAGVLCLRLSNRERGPRSVSLTAPDVQRTVRLGPWERRLIALPLRTSSVWSVTIRGSAGATAGGHLVFANLDMPRLLENSTGAQGDGPQCR